MNAWLVLEENLKSEALPSSQLFGEAEFPEEWLEKDVFAPCEFFLCKLDLSVFGGESLTDRGFLYVFIDMPSTIRKAKAVVRYFAEEPDACTDFNEGFFDEDFDARYILPNEKTSLDIKRKAEVIDEQTDDCFVVVNERKNELLTVISVAADYLPDELDVERLTVAVNAEQAKRGDFSSAKLVF